MPIARTPNRAIGASTSVHTPHPASAAASAVSAPAMADAKFTLARAPQFFQPKLQPGEDAAAFEQQRLNRTLEIVRSRVDKLGVSEPLLVSNTLSRLPVMAHFLKTTSGFGGCNAAMVFSKVQL